MKEPIRVGMGEYKVAGTSDILTCVGLGSCVAIALYDQARRIGGLSHIMLPKRADARNTSNPAKFADSAIGLLLKAMQRQGSSLKNLTAKIFGGANMFPMIQGNHLVHVGLRNAAAVRETLAKRKIEIVAEDLGGHWGRTIFFHTEDGSVRVRDARGEERIY
jgi:chemotaxis protein CheD